MQSLDIISVNLWQILISLLNLTLLFLILKHFLYKPVTKMIKKRQDEIEEKYSDAEKARQQALADEERLRQELSGARLKAEGIVKEAADNAARRGESIIEDARAEAEGIIEKALTEAQLERKRAEASIKTQIVEVGAALTEKLLEREINADDHKSMIDSFIEKIGEEE